MENRRLLNPRSWSTLRKVQIAAAFAGCMLTVVIYIGAKAALLRGYEPFGPILVKLSDIIDWPAYWLITALRLPLNFWEYTFLPGTSGLICAALVNALMLSAAATAVCSLCRKPRNQHRHNS